MIAAALLVVVRATRTPRLDAYLAAAISVSFWLAAPRGDVRVAIRRQGPGAQRLLSRAARPDRAPRLDRARRAEARARDRGRGDRRGRAPRRPAVPPPDRLSGDLGDADAPAALAIAGLRDQGGRRRAIVVPASIAAAALVLFVPRRYVLALPLLVLVYFLVSLPSIERRMTGASEGSRFSGISNPHRDWIDRAVPAGAEVSVLWTGEGDIYPVWQNEFFSRSVGTIYSIAGQLLGGAAADHAVGRRASGDPAWSRRPSRAAAVLARGRQLHPCRARRSLATRCKGSLSTSSRARCARRAKVTGLYDDTWSGAQRHLHAPRLRGRHRLPRAAAQRSEPLHRAADGLARSKARSSPA